MRMTLIGLAGREMTALVSSSEKPGLTRRSLPCVIAPVARAIFLVMAMTATLGACDALRLDPDRELAPAGNVDRVWIPPPSIKTASEAGSYVENLRPNENGAQQGPYDLPALVDLGLRTSPRTQH